MNVTALSKAATKAVVDNSPAILTAVAVTGTASTAILAAKGGIKASQALLERDLETRLSEFTKKEQFLDDVKTTWKFYIPAATTGLMTVACIVGATTVNNKRNAALISAYSLSEKAFVEYKDKVVETIGEKKNVTIQDEVARDRIKNNPPVKERILATGKGDKLCYESWTGRYFYSDIETIRQAQNDVNEEILNSMSASLNEFHDRIGLEPSQAGEEVGWTTDRMLRVQFSSMLTEDSTPCLVVGYEVTPVRGFHKLG